MPSSDPEPRSSRTGLAAVLLGMLLVALSFLPAIAGERARWTTERAREYQNASLRIQQLTHELGDQQPDDAGRATEEEYRAAIDHFQDLQAELHQARSDRGLLKTALRVLGGGLVVGGMVRHLAARREHREIA